MLMLLKGLDETESAKGRGEEGLECLRRFGGTGCSSLHLTDGLQGLCPAVLFIYICAGQRGSGERHLRPGSLCLCVAS
jgi:hypothetical protein